MLLFSSFSMKKHPNSTLKVHMHANLPESQLSGLSGSGWAIKAIIALQTDWSVQAGLHAFFKISRQISPVYIELVN